MYNLNTLLNLICERTNLHICIHDISGILRCENLIIDKKYHVHTKPICNAAKSTPAGYSTCVTCKNASNKNALYRRITRVCPFGILEIVSPVIIDGKTKCLVYLGNISENIEKSTETVISTCERIGASPDRITRELSGTELLSPKTPGIEYYEKLSDFICGFIRSVYSPSEMQKHENGEENRHWCVERAEEHIRNNYENSMTLSSIASLYFINEKYLGRIFKKETGKSFHEYLTDIRLEKSVQLLSEKRSVISVSQMCGFANVTYFNRCFKKKYGMSPGEYREKK